MFAEYVQRHLNEARYQFYAAIHDAECEAVKEQTSLLKNKYKQSFVFVQYINAIHDSQSERPTVLSREKPQDQACSRQMYQQSKSKKTGAIDSRD
jgi:hypothetical protein